MILHDAGSTILPINNVLLVKIPADLWVEGISALCWQAETSYYYHGSFIREALFCIADDNFLLTTLYVYIFIYHMYIPQRCQELTDINFLQVIISCTVNKLQHMQFAFHIDIYYIRQSVVSR